MIAREDWLEHVQKGGRKTWLGWCADIEPDPPFEVSLHDRARAVLDDAELLAAVLEGVEARRRTPQGGA